MMGSRPVSGPDDVIIWSAAWLLGVTSGIGAAFALWSQFNGMDTSAPELALGVVMLGGGLALLGMAIENRVMRVCLWVACASFVASVFLGGPAFSAILG